MKDKMLAEWFWIDRWEGSSAVALPMEQQGLYRAMLTRAWRLGGSLPADPGQIQREVRCSPAEWKRAWPAVSRYWRAADDDPSRLVNDTQLEVMEECRRRRDAASEHGKKAAQARHDKSDARAAPEDIPGRVPEHSPGTNLRSPVSGTTDYPVGHPRTREGQPGELEALQRQALDALEAAHLSTRQERDVLLTRASRAPNGSVLVNIRNCTSVPWLRTTIQRLTQFRMSAEADRAPTPPPPPTEKARQRRHAANVFINAGLVGDGSLDEEMGDAGHGLGEGHGAVAGLLQGPGHGRGPGD